MCDELSDNGGLSSQLHVYEKTSDRIIMASEHFLVMPDIRQIVPGHLLLLTKEHLTCFAQVPAEWEVEFCEIRHQVLDYVQKRWTNPFLFEHGSPSQLMTSGVCIHHAHIHIIPQRVPVIEEMQEYGELIASHVQGCPFEWMLRHKRGISDYLFYQDQGGLGYLVLLERSPPQQFIRRVVAEHLSIYDWNWKGIFSRLNNT